MPAFESHGSKFLFFFERQNQTGSKYEDVLYPPFVSISKFFAFQEKKKRRRKEQYNTRNRKFRLGVGVGVLGVGSLHETTTTISEY
jgi:hypothetical protein